MRTITFLTMLFSMSLFAHGPTVECRFAAIEADGDVELDETVAYTLDYNLGIDGDFDPYSFEIQLWGDAFDIEVSLYDEPLSNIQVPLENIVSLPVGASIFGINTIHHEDTDGFVSLRYECIKVLW